MQHDQADALTQVSAAPDVPVLRRRLVSDRPDPVGVRTDPGDASVIVDRVVSVRPDLDGVGPRRVVESELVPAGHEQRVALPGRRRDEIGAAVDRDEQAALAAERDGVDRQQAGVGRQRQAVGGRRVVVVGQIGRQRPVDVEEVHSVGRQVQLDPIRARRRHRRTDGCNDPMSRSVG